jgi:hypothetical protein
MHYLDAKLVRFVLTEMEALTIHDSFGVRLGELHILIDKVNAYYGEYTNESYNPNVLL